MNKVFFLIQFLVISFPLLLLVVYQTSCVSSVLYPLCLFKLTFFFEFPLINTSLNKFPQSPLLSCLMLFFQNVHQGHLESIVRQLFPAEDILIMTRGEKKGGLGGEEIQTIEWEERLMLTVVTCTIKCQKRGSDQEPIHWVLLRA